jgi:protein-tyrosine-phosphatase
MSITSRAETPALTKRTWWLLGGVLGLAFGYFLWYTPYAAWVKVVSGGLLSGVDKPANGLVLLPAAALGTLAGAPLFLTLTGWRRYIGTRKIFGRTMRFPSRTMLGAGFFMALVIGTTTLNYTFAGISILFVLILMRAGVMVLAPIVDVVHRRRVRAYSWVALGFSLLAAGIALSDVNSYVLTVAAVLSLGTYLTGYIGRFRIMSKVAKTGDEQTDRRYFTEEMISSAVWLVLLCAIPAVTGLGSWGMFLREGFVSFLFTPAAIPAFVIGLLYSALYVYGTLIYLDPREYTWCVPANRVASVFAALFASYLLTWIYGVAAPGPFVLTSAAVLIIAIAALSYPAWRSLLRGRSTPTSSRLLLFVCGGNTCRSAMAEAIARTSFADRWRVASAGINATPSAPMPAEVVTALRELGITADNHQARRLTPGMIAEASVVYCMTAAHRDAVIAMVPDAAPKTTVLDPDGDLPDPHGQPQAAYAETAERIRYVISQRMAEPESQLAMPS